MSANDGGAELTPAQIELWRDILCLKLGSFAWSIPPEDIQMHVDKLRELLAARHPSPAKKE